MPGVDARARLLARRRRAAAAARRGAPRPGQGRGARAAMGHAGARVVDHVDRRPAALLPRTRRRRRWRADAIGRRGRVADLDRAHSTALRAAARPSLGEAAPSRRCPFVARAQAMLAVAPTRDPLAFDLRPEAVARAGGEFFGLLTSARDGPHRRRSRSMRRSRGLER